MNLWSPSCGSFPKRKMGCDLHTCVFTKMQHWSCDKFLKGHKSNTMRLRVHCSESHKATGILATVFSHPMTAAFPGEGRRLHCADGDTGFPHTCQVPANTACSSSTLATPVCSYVEHQNPLHFSVKETAAQVARSQGHTVMKQWRDFFGGGGLQGLKLRALCMLLSLGWATA